MAKLPLHPRLATMLLAAEQRNCLYPAALAAAMLGET